MNHSRCGTVLCAITILSVGCGGGRKGPDLYEVSGRVTHKGQPVADAEVSFQNPESPRAAYGRTNARGEYRLTTLSNNDGAVAGEHTVTIVKIERQESTVEMSPDEPGEAYDAAMQATTAGTATVKSELPAEYADPATSGLKRRVAPGAANTFDFDLD